MKLLCNKRYLVRRTKSVLSHIPNFVRLIFSRENNTTLNMTRSADRDSKESVPNYNVTRAILEIPETSLTVNILSESHEIF